LIAVPIGWRSIVPRPDQAVAICRGRFAAMGMRPGTPRWSWLAHRVPETRVSLGGSLQQWEGAGLQLLFL